MSDKHAREGEEDPQTCAKMNVAILLHYIFVSFHAVGFGELESPKSANTREMNEHVLYHALQEVKVLS